METKKKNNKKKTNIQKNNKKKSYTKRVSSKDSKVNIVILVLLVISLIGNIFMVYHFSTFNHKEVKKVIEKKEIVGENILFLGDSITEYYDLDKYYSDFRVVNSGISGNAASDILEDMKKRVYNYNPSKVFLLIGTNDIEYQVEDEKIIKNIEKIIEKIKNNRPNAKIYLESIYPINNTDSDKIDHGMVGRRTNDKIRKINKELKAYCKSHDVTYIDVYKELADSDGNIKLEYTKEGLHLSDKGYEVVTKVIKEYLK